MVVATGFFDGVHLGHRLVIERLVAEARSRGEESLVVTFWPHPRNVLQKDARVLRLLTSLDEKKTLLKGMGVDRIEVVPFTREFSALSSKEYFSQVVSRRFGGTAVLLGYDNRVGGDNLTSQQVESVAREAGLDVIRTEAVASDKGAISSTKIRSLIAAGDVERANAMLGYEYSLFGVVVSGNQLGRTIGFPTANMQLYEPLKLVPGGGVYAVRVETLGRQFLGMCNIGTRPTVSSGSALTIETNIFDFDEDIYGLDIRISFIGKVRDERKFASLAELKAQLEADRRIIAGF